MRTSLFQVWDWKRERMSSWGKLILQGTVAGERMDDANGVNSVIVESSPTQVHLCNGVILKGIWESSWLSQPTSPSSRLVTGSGSWCSCLLFANRWDEPNVRVVMLGRFFAFCNKWLILAVALSQPTFDQTMDILRGFPYLSYEQRLSLPCSLLPPYFAW
jgi:hypothetical protein